MTKASIPAVAVILTLLLAAPLSAELSVGMSADSQGLSSFYLNVSNYYHVPQERVIYAHERMIPDDEIPVVFFLAMNAHVGPDIIIQQRLSGMSYTAILLHYRLSPAIFYYPVSGRPGPPYGNAYGYYRKYPKHQWHKIRLADGDVVNLVNLRFVSEHYGYAPEQVMRHRAEGRHFHDMKGKGGKDEAGPQGGNGGKHGGKGKGKGKGKH